MLGIHSELNKESQKFRIETGTATSIQSLAEPDYFDSEAFIQQSCKENRTVNNEGYNYKTNSGILGAPILSRTIPFVKTLKTNPTSHTIQILSSLNSQLPEHNWTSPLSYTNLTKYSYRYYIYTLKRILI